MFTQLTHHQQLEVQARQKIQRYQQEAATSNEVFGRIAGSESRSDRPLIPSGHTPQIDRRSERRSTTMTSHKTTNHTTDRPPAEPPWV